MVSCLGKKRDMVDRASFWESKAGPHIAVSTRRAMTKSIIWGKFPEQRINGLTSPLAEGRFQGVKEKNLNL